MSCKYNNSMYTITPPEDEVEFDYLEQILLSDEQMLEFARAGELAYGGK